jgi:iron complex transport system ATP-binding protein
VSHPLEVRALSVRLAGRDVLRSVDLSLAPGAIVGLIGPNGAGKSTLLRAISGLQPIASGEARIGATSIADAAPASRARLITYVGGESETDFPLTARETVALGTYALGLRKLDPSAEAALERVMRETDCLPYADRPITRLSSGERQRVHLARALLQNPKWICLDEAFSRLDLHHQAAMGALLRRYVSQGTSFLFVSHDLNFTTDWADECVLLKDGTVVASGPTRSTVGEPNLRKLYPDAEFEIAAHPSTGALKVYFRAR